MLALKQIAEAVGLKQDSNTGDYINRKNNPDFDTLVNELHIQGYLCRQSGLWAGSRKITGFKIHHNEIEFGHIYQASRLTHLVVYNTHQANRTDLTAAEIEAGEVC